MAAATPSGKGTVSPGHNHVFVVVFPKTSSSQGAEEACAGVSGLLPAQGCKLRGQRVLGIGIEPKLLALLSPRAQHLMQQGWRSFLFHRRGRCGSVQPRDLGRDSQCDEQTKLV